MAIAKKTSNSGRKVRKLFHLEPQDTKIIESISKSRKISESEVVRQAVRELGIKEGTIKDPFSKLIGSVKAGKDRAINHDRVLYE